MEYVEQAANIPSREVGNAGEAGLGGQRWAPT